MYYSGGRQFIYTYVVFIIVYKYSTCWPTKWKKKNESQHATQHTNYIKPDILHYRQSYWAQYAEMLLMLIVAKISRRISLKVLFMLMNFVRFQQQPQQQPIQWALRGEQHSNYNKFLFNLHIMIPVSQ